MLLVAALVASASLVVGACGSSGVTPSAGTPSTIEPSSAVPSSGASPSASLDTDALAALDAFRAFIQTDQTFHLIGDMQLTIDRQLVDIDMVEDISGSDESGTADIKGTRLSIHMAIVTVGAKGYVKIGNRKWERVDAAQARSNPLGDLQIDQLKPIDFVNVGGVPTHHFRADDPAALDPATLTGNTVTDLKLKTSSFDLYINDDGVPLLAKLAYTANGP